MAEMFDAQAMREGVSGSGHSSSLVVMPFVPRGTRGRFAKNPSNPGRGSSAYSICRSHEFWSGGRRLHASRRLWVVPNIVVARG